MNGITCKDRYKHLSVERDEYLDRARQVSKLTLPTIFPEDYFSHTSEINTPYQSVGARAVNNLASKLLLALLPPNTPFFKFSIEDLDKEAIESQIEGLTTEISKALSLLEQRIVSEIEGSQLRIAAYQAFIQLIIGGNTLLYLGDLSNIRVFKLSNYVVQRDASGEVLEIIVKETVATDTLPEELQALALASPSPETPLSNIKQTDIYTKIRRISEDKYITIKEIGDTPLVESTKTHKKEELPYIPLRFSRIDGENYGRGYAEEYLGDLVSLEGLTKSIVEASHVAAKTIFMVNPAGTVQVRELAAARNGSVISGNAEDVTAMRVDKTGDFRFAFETATAIQQRLAGVFLLNSSVQRDAERVTAEEIRLMARELEESLGGIYSVLAQEFQLPLINIITSNLKRKGKMPPLPKNLVKTSISTGLEALGRGHDLQKLNAFMGTISQMGEGALSYVNVSNYIERVALSLGLNIQGLIKSKEQIAAEQQQAFEQSPEMVNQTGQLIKQEMANEGRAGEGEG